MFRIKNIIFVLKTFSLLVMFLFTSCRVQSVQNQEFQTISIVDSTGRDESIVQRYLPYKERIDSVMNLIIGYAATNLEKGQPESTLGNFFSDVLLEFVKEHYPDSLGNLPSMVLLNNGGFRTELKKGYITVGDIYRLMPFDNTITIVRLKGIDMQKLFNFIARKGGMPIAGVRLIFEATTCTKAYFNDLTVDENGLYNVITSNYLASGGDGLDLLKDAIKVIELQVLLRDAFINSIKKMYVNNLLIEGKKDGRIKYVTQDE